MKLLMNGLSKLFYRINHMKLQKLIEDGDVEGLKEMGKDIADYVDYEMT